MAAVVDRLVLDASVAIAWHLRDEEYSDRARRLLGSLITGELRFVAPEHIRYEVPNAITMAARRRDPRLTQAEAQL